MNRGLWFLAGAGAGVYSMIRARRVAEIFTVDGLKDRLGAVETGVRLFTEEFQAGREERETELRERLGLGPNVVPELERPHEQAEISHIEGEGTP